MGVVAPGEKKKVIGQVLCGGGSDWLEGGEILRLHEPVVVAVMLEEQLITNKSLFLASSWYRLYLLIKDARSFEHKVTHFGFSPCIITVNHFY